MEQIQAINETIFQAKIIGREEIKEVPIVNYYERTAVVEILENHEIALAKICDLQVINQAD